MYFFRIFGKYHNDKCESLIAETINGNRIYSSRQAQGIISQWQERIRCNEMFPVSDWRIEKYEVKTMNIKFYTAGQGLMTIEINNKITDWSISNNKGKWQVYYKWTDYTFGKDLSRFIHDNKKLTQEVKKIIEQNYDKVIEQTR